MVPVQRPEVGMSRPSVKQDCGASARLLCLLAARCCQARSAVACRAAIPPGLTRHLEFRTEGAQGQVGLILSLGLIRVIWSLCEQVNVPGTAFTNALVCANLFYSGGARVGTAEEIPIVRGEEI